MTHADVTPGKAVDLGLSAIWVAGMWEPRHPTAMETTLLGERPRKNKIIPGTTIPSSTTAQKQSWILDITLEAPSMMQPRAKWGNEWRLPTLDEMRELRERCACRWVIYNGVKGIKATGPNGNSIFLPAAGNYWGEELNYDEEKGMLLDRVLCLTE